MIIGLRIFALIIDVAFCFGTLVLIMTSGGWLITKSGVFGLVLMPLWLITFFIWPILYFTIPTGIWGKTLGKMICRLKVTGYHGHPSGFWRGLGREMLKCLAICSGIGIMLALFQILYQGVTWYDHICDTQVEFNPYVRLTAIQKNWRKINKDKISFRRKF